MLSPALRCSWVWAALLLVTPAAHALWTKDYPRALALYQDGKYAEAREKLLAVIAENPTPTLRGNLGGRRKQGYLPQLFLGLSSAAMGNCAEALRYLRDPALMGVVAGTREVESQRSAAAEKCDRALALVAPKPAPPAVEQSPLPPSLTQSPPDTTVAPGPAPTPAPPERIEPPAQTMPVPIPTSTALNDTWNLEARSVRRLLQNYLSAPAGELELPPSDSFRSVRGRQWRTLLEALDLAGRAMLMPSGDPIRERLLGQARGQYRAAAALGALPPHEHLCAPGMLRIIRQ